MKWIVLSVGIYCIFLAIVAFRCVVKGGRKESIVLSPSSIALAVLIGAGITSGLIYCFIQEVTWKWLFLGAGILFGLFVLEDLRSVSKGKHKRIPDPVRSTAEMLIYIGLAVAMILHFILF